MTATQFVLAVFVAAAVSLVVRYINQWCWFRIFARRINEAPLGTYRDEVSLPQHVEEGIHPALSTMFGLGIVSILAGIIVSATQGSRSPVSAAALVGIGLAIGVLAPLCIAFLLAVGNWATGVAAKRAAPSEEAIRLISLGWNRMVPGRWPCIGATGVPCMFFRCCPNDLRRLG